MRFARAQRRRRGRICASLRGRVSRAAAAPRHRLAPTLPSRPPPQRRGVNANPGLEEVALFKEVGAAIVFANPKVQANIASNTYVVSGTAENKTAQEVAMAQAMAGGGMAGINPAQLKALQEALKANGGAMPGMAGAGDAGDDEEGLPELEGDFEAPA